MADRTNVYKSKAFGRFTKANRIDDERLLEAIEQVERGLVDADLGGNVIKQRIARKGQGKSGGFRTIILCKVRERAVFVHGYAKNERENITQEELEAFKMLAQEILGYDESAIAKAVEAGALIQIERREENEKQG